MGNVPNGINMRVGGDRGRTIAFVASSGISALSSAEPPKTRTACIAKLLAKLCTVDPSTLETFRADYNYSSAFSGWINATYLRAYREIKLQTFSDDGVQQWTVKRKAEWTYSGGVVIVEVSSSKRTLKDALNYSAWLMLRKVTQLDMMPTVQMEQPVTQESIQGRVDQESDKQENTIITVDTTNTVEQPQVETTTDEIASSEPTAEFAKLTNRWMPITTFKVEETDLRGKELAHIIIPRDLYTSAKCAPNITPFESYVYGKMILEVRIVLNANKFQAGKIVAAYKHDSYHGESASDGYQGLLSRPHVMLDLPSRNEGTLRIPFHFRRAFVRLAKTSDTSIGVATAYSSSVSVKVLSPLVVATDGLKDCMGQIFYRFVDAKFAGMSYRVVFQMDGETIDTVVRKAIPTKSIRALIRGAEAMLDQLGSTTNQDKPSGLSGQFVIPTPRLYFTNAKGISDAHVLRMNPKVLTSFDKVKLPEGEPTTTLDIARIWGLREAFTWATTAAEGTVIFDKVFSPSLRVNNAGYTGALTPMEHMVNMYQFWSGPMEVRFDFVSTSFHTGTVLISVEFNRPKAATPTLCQTASTYTKTFHLGEQKSVTIVVPYIYDTLYRRHEGVVYSCNGEKQTSEDLKRMALSVAPDCHTRIRVTVINAMRPVPSVSQTIEVLVYVRAGENFSLMGLKQVSGLDTLANQNEFNLPFDFAPSTTTSVTYSDYDVQAVAQMDNGEKEDEDETHTLSQGVSAMTVQSLDSHVGLKDILRRPVVVILDSVAQPLSNTNNGFFVPVRPPSRSTGSFNQFDSNAAQNVFNSSITKTPQAHIVNMFRHWRGSTRYTIVLDLGGTTAKVVYVSYVPHSGAVLYGNRQTGTYGQKVPIYASGFATEMIIPSVNPTLAIEVPYETENTWTWCWEESGGADYTWRDKADNNAGHLVIQPVGGTARLTVWWAAGDDFELSGWYGIPWTSQTDFAYRYDDSRFTGVQDSTASDYTNTPTSDYANKTVRTYGTSVVVSKAQSVTVANPIDVVATNKSSITSVDTTTAKQAIPQTKAAIAKAAEAAKRLAAATSRSAPRAQMDEWHDAESEPGTWWSKTKDFLTTSPLATASGAVSARFVKTAAIGMIPVVGPTLALTSVASDVSDKVTVTLDKVDRVSEEGVEIAKKLSRLADKADVGVQQILTMVQQTINQVVSGVKSTISVSVIIMDVFLDILISWIDRSWTSLGVGIVRFIIKLFPGGITDTLLSYGVQLGELFSRWWTYSTQPHTQADDDTFSATIVGLLAAFVGTLMGVHLEGYHGFSFAGLMHRITKASGVMYFVHMINFVKQIFSTVKGLVLQALGKVNPEAVALEKLSGKSRQIQRFIQEAQVITSEANTPMLSVPSYRLRFWKTVMQAYQLQRLMVEVPHSCVSPVLNRLCGDVIKVGNEKFLDISSCPVRYEPFVIAIEGPSNVGKSFMTEKLVTDLLDKVGYSAPTSGVAFYRTPGSEFWSGYRDQPVVVFDEFMQMRDVQSKVLQLKELYALKSTSTFIPNMAHLEEKRIRGNPLIVVTLTNNAFPALNEVVSTESVFRRRDVLIRVTMREEFDGQNPRDIDRVVTDNFDHLHFQHYTDVTDRHSLSQETVNHTDMKYWLSNKFQRYHQVEIKNVKDRMDRLFQVNRNLPVTEINVADPFAVYYSNALHFHAENVVDNLWLPTERLERDVEDIANLVARVTPPQMEVNYEVVFGERAPQPEAQILSVITKTALGMQTVFAHFFVAGQRVMEWMSDITVPRFDGPIAECAVCREQKPINRVCASVAAQYARDRTFPHATCEDCYRMWARQGHETCPVCRADRGPEIVTYNDLTLMAKFLAWIHEGTNRAAAALGMLARLQFGFARMERWLNMYDIILTTALLGGLAVCGELPACLGEVIVIAGTRLIITAVDSHVRGEPLWPSLSSAATAIHNGFSDIFDAGERELTRQMAQAQADEEPGGSLWSRPMAFRVQQVPELDQPMVQLVVTNESVERVVNMVEPSARCWHHLATQHVGAVVYRSGKLYLRVAPHDVVMGPGPCAGTRTEGDQELPCYWSGVHGKERMRIFYEQYLEHHRPTLSQSVIAWSTAPEVQQRFFEARVPLPIQPPWMANPIPLDQNMLNATSESWWEFLCELFEQYKTILTVISVATLVAGVIYGTYSVVAGTFSAENAVAVATGVQFQSPPEGRMRHARPQTPQRSPRQPYFQDEADLQSVVTRYITRNTMKLELIEQGTVKHNLYGLGIFNHKTLIPRHYVKKILEWQGEIMIGPMQFPYLMVPYAPSEKDFRYAVYNDLAVWEVPPSVNSFKDIRKFFVTEEDLTRAIPSTGLIHAVPTRTNPNMVLQEVTLFGMEAELTITDADNIPFSVVDVLKYNYSRSGACGSFVCLPRTQRPIISMHIAGVGEGVYGDGYGVVITQESLGDLAEVPSVQCELEVGPLEEAKIVFDEDTQVYYHGSVPANEAPYVPTKTKLRKSVIYGAEGLQVDVEPAILSPTDPRYIHNKSPLVLGCEAHGKLTVDFRSDMLDGPQEFLRDLLQTMRPIVMEPKKLSPEEAISGFDLDYYDPMDLRTSAGYPLNIGQKHLKQDWVDVERDEYEKIVKVTVHSELNDIINEAQRQRKTGKRYPTYFIDTLKDEKRKKKKVMEPGGTRVFCNGPFEHAIAMRQNFLHFSAAFMAQRKTLYHAVGINPCGMEWDWLARKLLAKSNDIMTLDYKNFGPGFNSGVAQRVMDLIREWTGNNVVGVDDVEMQALLAECSNSVHLCSNTVYSQVAGSPSGAVLTTVINSLVNLMYILVAWEQIMGHSLKALSKNPWEEFRKNVFVCVYGDDLIMSVKEHARMFNTVTISEFFATHKIVSTDASKTETARPWTILPEAEFLKRKFVYHPTRRVWMSQLRMESIKAATQWVWESPNAALATRVNAEVAMMLAHGHGPVEFQRLKNDVNAALIKARVDPVTLAWSDIDEMIYEHDFVQPY